MPEPRVFISYSVEDREFVEQRVVPLLETAGIKPYIAGWDVRAGEPLWDHVPGRIREADYVVGIVSSRGLTSSAVSYELGFATALDKPICLLVESGVALRGPLLSGRPYVQFDKGDPQGAANAISGQIAGGMR